MIRASLCAAAVIAFGAEFGVHMAVEVSERGLAVLFAFEPLLSTSAVGSPGGLN